MVESSEFVASLHQIKRSAIPQSMKRISSFFSVAILNNYVTEAPDKLIKIQMLREGTGFIFIGFINSIIFSPGEPIVPIVPQVNQN